MSGQPCLESTMTLFDMNKYLASKEHVSYLLGPYLTIMIYHVLVSTDKTKKLLPLSTKDSSRELLKKPMIFRISGPFYYLIYTKF